MRIFSALPRPVSPLVNPPPGVSPQPHRPPTERPERRRNTPTRPQQRNAVQRPTERRTAYTNTTAPTRPKPNHSTEPGRLFKITLYSNPDEVAAHRVAPTETHRQPHREPERRRGVMGSPTDRSRPQRRTGGIKGNRKRPEPKPGALRLIYSFSTGRREPPAEKSKCKLKSSFHPLTEP